MEIIGERFYDDVADRGLNYGGRVVAVETRLAFFSKQGRTVSRKNSLLFILGVFLNGQSCCVSNGVR
jgi:hypothetical protein